FSRDWSSDVCSSDLQSGWRHLSDADGRYHAHPQTADRVFARVAPTRPAARDIRGRRESRGYRAWWWRYAPPCTPPAPATGISAPPSPLASLHRLAQTRHPPRQCIAEGPYPDDPRGSPMKPVRFAERVATRDP